MSLALGRYSGRKRRMSRLVTRALYRIAQSSYVMRVILFKSNDKRLDPVAASVYRRMGKIKRRSGLSESAIRDYGAAIGHSTGSPALHFLRGAALLQIGEKARAAEDFKAALLLDQKNNTLLRLLRIAQGIDVEGNGTVS
jgi:tetratricopeptide (TPR) repeat protein